MVTFQELNKPVRKTGSRIIEPDNLIFVHGLQNSKTRGLRRSLKAWLRGIDLPNTRLTCMGFDTTDLLAKGSGTLISLSDALIKHIRQLQRSERYMFIAHGIAGWVVKESLSRCNSNDIASGASIIFLGSLHNDSEDWAAFTEFFLKQNSKHSRHGDMSIDQPERTHRKSITVLPKRRTKSPASTSSQTFRFLQDVVDSNFQLMCEQHMPVVEYIELQPRSKQRDIGLPPLKARRTDLSHSSSFSTEQLVKLSLLDVQPGTEVDRLVQSLLETRISREKSSSTDMADAGSGLPDGRLTPFSTEINHVREPAAPASPVMTQSSTVEASKSFPAASTVLLVQNVKPFEKSKDLGATQTKDFYENPEKEKQEPVRQSEELIKTKLILASVYHKCGKLEAARNVYEEMLFYSSKLVNYEDHELRFTIGCRVAEIQLQEGRFEEAETLFVQLERDTRREEAKRTRVALEISRWLGITFDKRGHFEKAYQKLEAVEKGIEEATRKCEPKQSPDLEKNSMLTKNALALVLAHMGKFAKAIAASDDAIMIAKRKGGAEADSSIHKTTINMNRAAIFADSGDYESASSINHELSKQLEKQFGPKNLATLECWSLQTQILIAESRHEEAQDRAQETLHGMRKELGKEHPSTLKLLGSVVLIYMSQGRIADAMETAQYVFQANQSSSALGPNHPQTISSMNAFAVVKAAAGQLQDAESLQSEVVKQAEYCLGEQHPDSLNYKLTLASIYCQMGEWAKSQALIRPIFWMRLKYFPGIPWKLVSDSVIPNNKELCKFLEQLQISSDSLIKAHPSLLTTMHCLGVAERERQDGDLSLAIKLLSVAATLRSERFNASHADTLCSQFELAKAERECGGMEKLQEASDRFEEVLTQRRKHFGESHPDTLSARHELGVTKFQMGYENEAAQEQAEVLKLKIRVLGTHHPDTIKSQLDMVKVYQSLGDIQSAENLQFAALTMQIRQSGLTRLGLNVADEDDKRRLYALILDRFVGKQYTESNFAPTRFREEPRYHADIVAAAADLASIYAELDDAAKRQSAAIIQDIVVGLQEQYLGNNDLTTLVSVNGLGLIYQALGRTQDAITQYERARKNSKANSVLHLASQSNLASLYFAEGDLKKAEGIQEAVLNGQRISASHDPKALIESMFNLALTRKERAKREGGGYVRALELMQDVVALSETLGHFHPLHIEMCDTLYDWQVMAEAEEEEGGMEDDPPST